MKRILSALLALLMLVSAFSLAGCSKEEEESEVTKTRVATTLTLWLPSEKGTGVDDESVAQVEKAINEVTQAAYGTAIKLKVVDGNEYDAAVTAKLQEIKTRTEEEQKAAADKRQEAIQAAAKGEEYVDTSEEEKKPVQNDYANEFEAMNATVFAQYPQVESTQFDIFVVHGFEMYQSLCDSFMLSELDDNIKDKSKLLKTYIYPTFLEAAKYMDSTYAVPNNHAMGTYKYMLINKEVATNLYYDYTAFDSVRSLFRYDDSGVSFIEDVMANVPGITPVVGKYSVPNTQYWNLNGDSEFSLLASLMHNQMTVNEVAIGNVFANATFNDAMYYSKKIAEIAPYAEPGTTDDFAVGFIEATAEEIAKYTDKYQAVVIENPIPTQEDIFGHMLAVSSYTKDLDRAMEIVTLINTNEELRTILQYGVEGVHWKKDVDDESIIHITSDKYQMNILDTGNVYMTYPGEGRPMSDWSASKKQNLDSFMSLSAGYTYVTESTTPLLDELATVSKTYWNRISAMGAEEFRNSTQTLRDEVNALDCIKKLTYDPTEKEDSTLKEEESIIVGWHDYLEDLRK